MGKKVSILHISDSHRGKDHTITNSSLLISLLNDREKYTKTEEPLIQTPDIIIACGDIIRGSTSKDNSDQEIQQQYAEAIDFLNNLANEFLGGQKERIVLVPGNHDVDWKYSKESMEQIDSTQIFDSNKQVKAKYLTQAINQHSNIRWSWSNLSFYKVKDQRIYNKRFEAFARFYSEFYNGKRSYSHSPANQYDVFDFPEFAISIVGYNSCYNTDHLNLVGDIHPDCIANSSLHLRKLTKKGRLLLAVWHHNTKGLPYDANYMNNSKLKNFIDAGIEIGFHGHQHITEVVQEYNNIIEQKRIVAFSAGALCSEPEELPTGQNQQYNIVEIEDNPDSNDHLNVTLHTREKTSTSSLDNPIWGQASIDSTNVSNFTTTVPKPRKATQTADLIDIEALMKEEKYEDAKKRLLKNDLNDSFVRKFLMESLLQIDDDDTVCQVFFPPKNSEETVYLLNSLLQLKDKEMMAKYMKNPSIKESDDPSVKGLIAKIERYLS